MLILKKKNYKISTYFEADFFFYSTSKGFKANLCAWVTMITIQRNGLPNQMAVNL